MKLNIVITMAGRGSRFYEAGYKVPKYEIMAHGRSLFSWSMLSLKNFIDDSAKVIFVTLKENKSAPYIRAQCEQLGIKNIEIVEIDQITDGQATSAYVSRNSWALDAPLLIYNIDTYVDPNSLQPKDIRKSADGWIPCFQVLGEHWSFVKLDSNGWASDITEKKRISNFASIGLYWFANASEYVQAYDKFFADSLNLVKGERYVAPLYRQLVKSGKKICISDLPVGNVHVLGTPNELNLFLSKAP